MPRGNKKQAGVERASAGSREKKNTRGTHKADSVPRSGSTGSKKTKTIHTQTKTHRTKKKLPSQMKHAEINPITPVVAPDTKLAQRTEHFEPDINKIRRDARRDIACGAVTPDYKADRDSVLDMLNQALSTEIVCVLRYRRHSFMARGIDSEPVAQEFMQHSNEELLHADKIAERIIQLGGEPDFNPDRISKRSHSEYVESNDLKTMIDENLVAERIAIESYRKMIEFVSTDDPTTRRLLEDILAVEEEHAEDLSTLLG